LFLSGSTTSPAKPRLCTGCKNPVFYIGLCKASETNPDAGFNTNETRARISVAPLVPEMGGNFMSDSDEKILPVIRLLLVAFFGLLFVLALQLFLLVTGANAGITDAHRNIAPLVSESAV
jgi:hypothetical protein